ncbi:MAG: hypothetical protein AAF557_05385 [Pseudomonadota bacterium]
MEDSKATIAQFLTASESAELKRIKEDPAVIGFTLIAQDGTELEASGAFKDLSAAVFANIFDVADRMGEEFGVDDTCPALFLEGGDLEVAGISMSSARAVFIKRRPSRSAGDLRSVG